MRKFNTTLKTYQELTCSSPPSYGNVMALIQDCRSGAVLGMGRRVLLPTYLPTYPGNGRAAARGVKSALVPKFRGGLERGARYRPASPKPQSQSPGVHDWLQNESYLREGRRAGDAAHIELQAHLLICIRYRFLSLGTDVALHCVGFCACGTLHLL